MRIIAKSLVTLLITTLAVAWAPTAFSEAEAKGSPDYSISQSVEDDFAAGLIVRFQRGQPPVDSSGNVVGSELADHKIALGVELGPDLYSVVFTERLPISIARSVSAKLSQHSMIVSAEPDFVSEVSREETQSNAPWHLDRIDERSLVFDSTYTNVSHGEGVNIYIVDTGVRASHSEFEGRVSASGFSSINDGRGTQDCDGHGTHVAATAAGKTYGVAKKATIVPVRVLDCSGYGSNSQSIQGVNWIANNHPAGVPGVANFSLGGPPSFELDQAIRNLVQRGITVVVASGNQARNACNYSPARVSEAITVNNATRSDDDAQTSNFGSCTDIYAPGTEIVSAGISSDTATASLSGTSMASPVVSGAAAVILSSRMEQGLGNTSPAQLWSLMREQATPVNFIADIPTDAKLLLYGLPQIKPNAPLSVRAQLVLSRATVAWDEPRMYFLNNAVASYTAHAWSASSGGKRLGSCTTTSTSCTITGISSSRAIWLDVRASNANGVGITSSRVSSGDAVSAPGSARNVVLITGSGSITARWTAPESAGGSAISNYRAEAYLESSGGSPVGSCSTSTTSCAITGLQNGTRYFVDVVTTSSAAVSSVLQARVEATPLINQVLTPTPVITGEARVGNTLIADPKAWDTGTTQSTLWRVGGTPQYQVDNQNPLEFLVLPEHVGKRISFEVASSGTHLQPVTRESTQLLVKYQNQPSFGRPSIEGEAIVGETLYASSGITDANFTTTFTWKRDGVAILGSGNSDSYTLTSSDASKKITVSATASSAFFYTVTRTSDPTSAVTGTFASTPTPTISGRAVLGKTLTAAAGPWTPSAKLKYQWLRNGSPINRATSSTYKLQASDLGRQISVIVSASRTGYSTTTIASDRTTVVLAPFTSKPALRISSLTTPGVGSPLTLRTSGSWNPAPTSISYQWFRNGEPISGSATSSSYRLIEADRGSVITVEARAAARNYIPKIVFSSAIQPLAGTPMSSTPTPAISGIAVVGSLLSAIPGDWESVAGGPPVNLKVRWFSGGTLVSSGSDTYTVTPNDAGKRITLSVTGSSESFHTVTRTSDPTSAVTGTFASTPTPTISGRAVLGKTLTAAAGPWTPSAKLKYQWLRNGSPINRATSSTYKLQASDLGRQISVIVSASRTGYSTTTIASDRTTVVLAPFTSKPALRISSLTTPGVGSPLTLRTSGSWNPAPTSISYQWFRNGEPITENASSITYQLTEDDIGASISAALVATRSNADPTTVIATNSVSALGYSFVSSSVPRITGLPVVGETLQASIDFWDEQVSFNVNWFRDGTLVSSGSDQYLVTPEDRNKRITVSVTGSRDNFHTMTRTSTPTTPVTVRFGTAPTPTISGTLVVGQILTASPGSWSSSPTLSFQWLRNSVAIPGAQSKNYQLQPADLNAQLTVRVTGKAKGHFTESRTSSQTDNVTPGTFSRRGTTVITGKLGRSQTIRAQVSGWSPGPTMLSYQWIRDGQIIAGATNSSYRLTDDDLARAISVQVSIGSAGYNTTTQTSRSRTDWSKVTLSRTVTARNQFASCASQTYGGWQGFGGTYRPCSLTYDGRNIEFYDPSSGFMIVRDFFVLPAGTTRWKLTFNNYSTSQYLGFAFASTDSSQGNSSNYTFFPQTRKGYLTTPWISQISDSRAYYVITGSSYGYGFLDLESITLTYETIK